MACERCAKLTKTAAYLLHKGGGSRRVNLCQQCRDITALVHVLEAVDKRRARSPGKETEAPETEEPEAEAPEAEAPETEEPESAKESEAPEAEEPEAEPAQPTRARRGNAPRR